MEAHKNIVSKGKSGKTTRSGRLEIYMILWLCHDPSTQELQLAMRLRGVMSWMKKLSTNQDVLKSGFDITKGKDNFDLQAFVQEHMGWESSVNV